MTLFLPSRFEILGSQTRVKDLLASTYLDFDDWNGGEPYDGDKMRVNF